MVVGVGSRCRNTMLRSKPAVDRMIAERDANRDVMDRA